MHVAGFAFECGAFDPTLMRSGTSALVWHNARGLAALGHRVSLVTPAHGRVPYLRDHYPLTELDYQDSGELPVVLDPQTWPGFPAVVRLSLATRVFHLRRDGVDVYFLSNEHLDALPGTFYPEPETEGRDLVFLKPLVFQAIGIRFLRAVLGGELLVQAYEPRHHHLLAAVLGREPRMRVVSTVATNNQVNEQAPRAQVRGLLEFFGVPADLRRYRDRPGEGVLAEVLREHLPSTRLHQEHDGDGVCLYSLIVEHADAVDFLCEGQREFYTTFAGTPFEQRFRELTVSGVIEANAAKFFVGGCGISDSWLARDPAAVDRARVLGDLGLDPELPTFYHAARYSVHHKGQLELLRAVDRVLTAGHRANFLLRCALGTGAADLPERRDPLFTEIAERHPDRIRLAWRMVGEDTLFQHAAAADFCLFPSKYEQDTFLIALGEAMAAGAVPIVTDQLVTRHFAPALTVPRSFREDDELLTAGLTERIIEAIGLHRDQPRYQRLSAEAVASARRFTWARSAAARAETFARLLAGPKPPRVPPAPPRATPPPFAEGAQVRIEPDSWSLDHAEAADRVEVFLPGNGRWVAHELKRTGHAHHGDFPGAPPAELVLLVTFAHGRSGWRRCRVRRGP